jgi:hypothetical protein
LQAEVQVSELTRTEQVAPLAATIGPAAVPVGIAGTVGFACARAPEVGRRGCR